MVKRKSKDISSRTINDISVLVYLEQGTIKISIFRFQKEIKRAVVYNHEKKEMKLYVCCENNYSKTENKHGTVHFNVHLKC